jgi:beta-lactam-binding protein with PASTA domain
MNTRRESWQSGLRRAAAIGVFGVLAWALMLQPCRSSALQESRGYPAPAVTAVASGPGGTRIAQLRQPPGSQRVPGVVNDPLEVAIERLEAAGFRGRIMDGPADAPGARIAAQDPPAGAGAPADRVVRLWLMRRGPAAVVPDVVGLSLEAAMEQLAALDLEGQPVDRGPADGGSRVIRQSPNGGAPLPENRIVRLLLAVPEEPVMEVPGVIGETAARAERLVRRHGLAPVFVDGDPPADAAVIRQDPTPGAGAAPGDPLRLWTQRMVEVPPVVDSTLAQAVGILEEHELRAEVDRRDPSPEDRVMLQEPEPGARVAAGSAVRLRTRPAAGELRVPGVTGESRLVAFEAVEAAGLVPLVAESSAHDEGRVIRQTPEANAPALPGDPVFLWFAPPREVPGVVGMDREAAFAAIEAADLVPLVAESSRNDRGRVDRQHPRAGASAEPGAPVSLWFARPETRVPGGETGDPPDGGRRPARPPKDLPKEPPGNDRGDDGWPGGMLPPVAAALGGLAAAWLLHRLNVRRRRRKIRRAGEPAAVAFEPHAGPARGRIEGGFDVTAEIRLEPVCDQRGVQSVETAGDLDASWEELP